MPLFAPEEVRDCLLAPISARLSLVLPTAFDGQYESMASSAVAHLNTFWVVGVVEQYYGFIEVLRRVLDPLERRPLLWPSAHAVMDNG